ncbi:23S rRNA (guanosine(2251)-2'-O)-methyltransferase RlmB [Wolbachia endosymbiont of Folsomia candida]|uniref:23S rRNA (guanosine(2251)-2'-O)-methyltransferase RlmB n=1 Tax=Wolbachia endosymbiont of Folsomia candida TaxID=169402 RepID=UPI000A92164C|nr:23S rRNA (guanosine(2251)-2'-O)-methyltransferase RlmB [Wolbachia endosymbiont of Folsomia candida]APR98235.1 23S rRNA (guanosine(2251)-2'-O)-methyltransferase RlmB [Wolbachia endosymbiont of Folsomia candida]
MKSQKTTENFWLYGRHTCISALKNKNRQCIELLVTENFHKEHEKEIRECTNDRKIKAQIVENKIFDSILPKGVNHQGIALKVLPISSNLEIEEVAENGDESSTIVILDQVTDTHNIGSILRTAACFNVNALVLPRDHSPGENASIAKAASGALDILPLVYVTNIVNTMKYLKKAGYWCYGFDCNTGEDIDETKSFGQKRVIVFGSEEKGMRRLVKENCDHLLKIPISNAIGSLNVSNAAAIGLYSVYIKTNASA